MESDSVCNHISDYTKSDDRLTERPTDRPSDRPTHRAGPTERPTDWLTDRPSDQPNRPSDRQTGRLSGKSIDWPTDQHRPTDWPQSNTTDWLADREKGVWEFPNDRNFAFLLLFAKIKIYVLFNHSFGWKSPLNFIIKCIKISNRASSSAKHTIYLRLGVSSPGMAAAPLSHWPDSSLWPSLYNCHFPALDCHDKHTWCHALSFSRTRVGLHDNGGAQASAQTQQLKLEKERQWSSCKKPLLW